MRICFITTGDVTELATMKRATGMANPLLKEHNNVAIIALNCENNKKRFHLECPNAEILYFELSNPLSEVKQKKELLKKWNPDVVYVCSFGFRNFIHRFNSKGKFFVVEHSELVSAIPNNTKRHLYFLLEILSILLFSGQVFASKYLQNVFLVKMKYLMSANKPYLYSPYAYSNKLMFLESSLFSRIKEKYANKKVVLYMGSLDLNYGFLDILKSIEILKATRQDVILLIMGSGEHKPLGEKYIIEKKLSTYVDMLGYVSEEDVASYFKLADVFVSPLYNTIQDKARCPSKLFLYLPFKKPIVTCKIGEAYELFGDDGYYFEPDDVSSLSAVLSHALEYDDLRYNIDEKNHEWTKRTKDFLNWIINNANLS